VKGHMVSDKVFPVITAQKRAQNTRSLHKISSVMVAAGGTSYPIRKFALSRIAEVFATEYEK
jgi:hypothetical protein